MQLLFAIGRFMYSYSNICCTLKQHASLCFLDEWYFGITEFIGKQYSKIENLIWNVFNQFPYKPPRTLNECWQIIYLACQQIELFANRPIFQGQKINIETAWMIPWSSWDLTVRQQLELAFLLFSLPSQVLCFNVVFNGIVLNVISLKRKICWALILNVELFSSLRYQRNGFSCR